MSAALQAELIGTGSHYVELNVNKGSIERESVQFYFAAEWRKQAVTVIVEARRYHQTDGLSQWQVYATDAREGSWGLAGVYFERGDNLTELARRRLGEVCVPIAKEWLGDETDYLASFRDAVYRAVKGVAYDLRPYSDPTWRFREAIDAMHEHLTQGRRDQLVAIADAYDRYAELYNKEA